MGARKKPAPDSLVHTAQPLWQRLYQNQSSSRAARTEGISKPPGEIEALRALEL